MNVPSMLTPELLDNLGCSVREVGIVVVDHGSRREESNQLLERVVLEFKQRLGFPIVEPAHMELAAPSIDAAFASAVAQGAKLVIGHPYFLAPGRHWTQDIPALFAEAAKPFPAVRYLVTAPLGPHDLMLQIMEDRIVQCLQHSLANSATGCDTCRDSAHGCQILRGNE